MPVTTATAAEIDLSNLSDRSIIVLAALVGAVFPDEIFTDCSDFGFMDHAYAALDSGKFSKPSFAGHVGALGQFIDWKQGYFGEVQFNVTSEVWQARQFIAECAAAIKARYAAAEVA